MRKTVSILLAMLLICACALAESAHIVALKGPTAMGMVKTMDEKSEAYDFQIMAAADEITPLLAKGEMDIAAVPANLAAILYQKMNGAICVLNVNTLGVLYIAERGDSVHSVADLKNRTIYSAGKGSTPEYALNFILTANGLTPGKDVTIEYKSEHTECLSAILNDANALAMLPQPFLTTAMTKADDVRMALDLTAEWDSLGVGSSMITGVTVARRKFVEENPELVRQFLTDYADSVEYVNANPAEAALLVEKFDIVPAAVAEKAIPACNIRYIVGAEMREKLSGYLDVLYQQNPDSVGGKLPDAQFYYVAE